MPHTEYTGSSGKPELISTMNPTRAQNAAAVIRRSGGDLSLAADLEAHATAAIATWEAANPDKVAAKAAAPKFERAIGPGDNNPPADPLTARLEETHAKLLDQIVDHEMAAALLPAVVNSDDDVAAINFWVVKARVLFRTAESEREAEKADYLESGRKVDSFFGALKTNITDRAKAIEQRSGPYLAAKKIKEQAERDAAAALAREEQLKREAAAAEQRRIADEAAAEVRRQEQAIRDAADKKTRDEAAEAARVAGVAAAAASKAAAAADKAESKGVRAVDRAERQADPARARLERTDAGGATAKLKMVRKHRITDGMETTLSLGPLGAFLAQAAIEDALARAAKADPWPDIPGVYFYEEAEVATHATKS